MDGIEIRGLNEITEKVSKFVKKCPDKAGDFLRKQALITRGKVVKEAKSAVNVDTSNKRSLGKQKSYTVSQVKGYGTGQYVELTANAPHFHLIEHGHELVSHSGRPIGWVPGYLIMDAVRKKRRVEMPKEFETMVDNALKEAGLK